MEAKKPEIKRLVPLISILFHIVVFMLFNLAVEWRIIGFRTEPVTPPFQDPIVFDLQKPSRPREVIESPEDARSSRPPENADFLSDKNARTRNPETDTGVKPGEAFSRGDFNTHELPVPPVEKGPPKPREEKAPEKEEPSEFKEFIDKYKTGVFYKDYVFKNPESEKSGNRDRLPTVPHENLASRALEMGGLAFNTYEWNFAPYLLELKKRIQRNIYPPIAFTRLGMISGVTLLRFKIYPDGELRDLRILGYQGDQSLMITSRTAIEISAPFPDLPADFPEPYLEVTGKFQYLIKPVQERGE
jgi:outer membrane biosynthesis protein TonB